MMRHQIDLRFDEIDQDRARAAVLAHHRTLRHAGDGFLPAHQLSGTPRAIVIDGETVGVVVVADRTLVLGTLTRQAKRYDRQVMEGILETFDIEAAYALSWDTHHVALFGGFAREVASQAYQFELLDPDELRPTPSPADTLAGLTLTTATSQDLPYLSTAGFLDDYTELLAGHRVRIARHRDRPVGIGLLVPHSLSETTVDLGMFTDPDVRRLGIGSMIIAETARECLTRGLTPVAGCWAKNWNSRPTLEAAGLTCVGTIFRFVLDPATFADSST